MSTLTRVPHARGALATATVLAVLALVGGSTPSLGGTGGISVRRILRGYDQPVLVTNDGAAGRTIFIVEQTGRIKRATYRDGAWAKLGTFLDISSKVFGPDDGSGSEQGLLGLAFHPRYADNGRFYVNYTRTGSGSARGDTVIAEYRRMSASRADPSSARTVMVVDQPWANHNGGHLAFGPDGYLYAGFGDGGLGGDPLEAAQDLGSRLGKILRFDPRDPDGSGPRRFRIPPDNPRVGLPGLDLIWLWGVRNPWRFSFDRLTGDLWAGDVGQGSWEEVDRAIADGEGRNAGRGRDLGWDDCEGGHEFEDDEGDGDDLCDEQGPDYLAPVHEYAHGAGRCSVTGGYVFRGAETPDWQGFYVAGDYCSGEIWAFDGGGARVATLDTSLALSSFGEDAAGRLFATSLAGGIYRVRFSGSPPPG